MPVTVTHALSMTTPDNPAYENQPQHWNSAHAITLAVSATEISGLFSNANGISFGLSNSSITASHNALTTAAASNHSHGNPTLALTNLSGTTASASNGLTLSLSAAAPGAATITVSAVGNTTVNSSGTWPGALSLRAYGVLSAGTSNGSLLLSTPDPVDFTYMSVGNTNAGNTAGDTGVFSQRVVFHAGNNITFSGSSNGGSATFSIIGGAGGAGASFGVSNVGNTSGNTGLTGSNLVLSGGNGVTLSQSTHANGATVGVSVATSYAASNHSHGDPTLNLTNLSGTTASNSAGFTLSLSAGNYLTTAAVSNHSHGASGANGSFAFQTLSFSNANGISFGTSAGSAITASHNAITTARASTDAIGLNTAATNVTWTVNSSGLSLNASGYAGTATAITGGAVMTHNSAGFSFNGSGLAGTATAVTGGATITLNSAGLSFNGTALAGTATALTGAIAATVNSGGVSISVPATSSLVGTHGISVSTNGSTISVLPQWRSFYENDPTGPNQTMTFNGASVSHALQFVLDNNISASYIRLPVRMTTNSTTIATSAATRNVSGAIYSTWNAVIYSLGTGASSRSLQSVASGSNGWTFMNSLSIAVNGTQYSVTQAFSANAEGAGTTRSTQYSISNTNYSLTTNQIATEWSSGRYVDIPFANSLSAGAYWLVLGYSTSSATNSAGAWTDANVRYSNHYGVSATNMAFGVMGSTNLTSTPFGAGSFSTAGGGTTASIPLSAISSSASHVRPYFQIIRQA